MKKSVGLWIDHRQAVIVINLDQEEEIKRVTSNIAKRIRYSGASQSKDASELHQDTTEDGRDRRIDNQLNQYYEEVTSYLRDADSILIIGPGEAKVELQKRLESHGDNDYGIVIKPADKLTDDQIVAAVQQHFRETQFDVDNMMNQEPNASR